MAMAVAVADHMTADLHQETTLLESLATPGTITDMAATGELNSKFARKC